MSSISFYRKYHEYNQKLKNSQVNNILEHRISLLRSILQVSSISTICILSQIDEELIEEFRINELLNRFKQPSDGLPIEIIDKILVLLRDKLNNNRSFLNGWYEKNNKDEPLNKRLQGWVNSRNNIGHGAPSEQNLNLLNKEMEELIDDSLEILKILFPSLDNDLLTICIDDTIYNIDINLFPENKLYVIRGIKSKRGVFIGNLESIDFEEDIKKEIKLKNNNIFERITSGKNILYRITEFHPYRNGESHCALENIPNKLTEDFVGRDKELQELIEWFNDDEESSCLLYGDGGYGKTTLVLEFLNQLIDSTIEVTTKKIPEIICFYSAKETKWYDGKIIYLKGGQSILEDSLRELIRFIEDNLDKKWYCFDEIDNLIDCCEQTLRKHRYTRDHVLFIIDNTETLIEKNENLEKLAKVFKKISKKIGRLIITSRRRENISGTPIQISALSEEDCLVLMDKLSNKHSNEAVKSSAIGTMGKSKKQDLVKQLMYKPILIEYIVNYLILTQVGVKSALDILFSKTNIELLEFLYEDAYRRINNENKNIFIIIAILQDASIAPINEITLPYICQHYQTQIDSFLHTLDETHFANIQDNGGMYEIELVNLAKSFFLLQKNKLKNEDQIELDKFVSDISKYFKNQTRIIKEYQEDRISIAFRNRYAKAARIAANNNDPDLAIENYNLAIIEDPTNQYLFDRYAVFLLKIKKYEDALIYSNKSIEIDDKNHDALVTYALINYRLGNIEKGDIFIDKAQQHGRGKSYCLLEKCIARYHKAKEEYLYNTKDSLKNLREAKKFLDESDALLSTGDRKKTPYFKKIKSKIDMYKQKIRSLEQRII
jgi:putative uncharacterized protein h16_A3231